MQSVWLQVTVSWATGGKYGFMESFRITLHCAFDFTSQPWGRWGLVSRCCRRGTVIQSRCLVSRGCGAGARPWVQARLCLPRLLWLRDDPGLAPENLKEVFWACRATSSGPRNCDSNETSLAESGRRLGRRTSPGRERTERAALLLEGQCPWERLGKGNANSPSSAFHVFFRLSWIPRYSSSSVSCKLLLVPNKILLCSFLAVSMP